jgi:hypothetical protein
MVWLVLGIIAALLVVVLALMAISNQATSRAARYNAAVGLHTVHRRMDMALTKSEVRGHAAQLRRELNDELRSGAHSHEGNTR